MKIEATLTTVERTLFLLEVEQFRPLGSEEVAAIAGKMVEMRFAAGEVVYENGDPEGHMYVVVDGELEHVREGIVVRRAKRGMSAGLFGLMGIPDVETLRAAVEAHVLSLSREEFIDAVSDSPAFALGLMRGLANSFLAYTRRIESLERRLAALEGRAEAP
jgi:CRP-like cAMP-binding protein